MSNIGETVKIHRVTANPAPRPPLERPEPETQPKREPVTAAS